MRFDSGLLGHNGDVSIYPPIDEWAETLRILESGGGQLRGQHARYGSQSVARGFFSHLSALNLPCDR